MCVIIRFEQIQPYVVFCSSFFVHGHGQAHCAAVSLRGWTAQANRTGVKKETSVIATGEMKIFRKKNRKKLEISQKEPHKRIYATCMKEYGRRIAHAPALARFRSQTCTHTHTYAESHRDKNGCRLRRLGCCKFSLFSPVHTHTSHTHTHKHTHADTFGCEWPSVEWKIILFVLLLTHTP